MNSRIGILALQGAFASHANCVTELGHTALEVRTPADLSGLDGLIMPGGESSTMSQLLESSGLLEPIRDAIADGFVWKFDDELNSRMKITGDFEADFVGLQCPVSLIYGEQSASFSVKSAEHMRALNPNLKVEVLKAAQHHLFLDQPIEFIAQLKTELMQF